jgi:hypothetical protein
VAFYSGFGSLDRGAFPPGDEDWDELVAAFADLFAEGFDVEGDVDDGEGVSPCGGVEPVAFDEGSVDVGEDCFYHLTHLWECKMVG